MNIASGKIITILTVLLFFTFYALNLNVYGSYLFLGLSLVIMLINAFENNGKIKFSINNYHKYVLSFALFCLLSSVWAWNRGYSVEKGITIIEVLICMSMIGTYFFASSDGNDLLKCVKWGGYIVSIYSIFSYGLNGLLRIMQAGERAGTSYANVNSIAMACAYTIVIALFFAMRNGFTWTDLLCVPCIIMVVASGTRKAVLTIAIGVFFMLLFNSKERKSAKNILRVIGIIVVLSLGMYILAHFQLIGGISHRMEGIFNYVLGSGKVDSSTIKRGQFIAIGIEQFKDTPILGIGIGNPRILLRNSVYGLDVYLHNNYAELLAGGGIVGFLFYYSIHLYLLRAFWRRRKTEAYSLFYIVFILLMLINDYGSVSYYSKSTYFYFLMMFTYLKRNPEGVVKNAPEIGENI